MVITHLPTGISGQASERRSQHENRDVAIQRLRLNLAISHRTETHPEDRSEVWKRRCRGEKIIISCKHEDFAAIIAEALDVLRDSDCQLATAAKRLECTTSQLIKLLKMDSAVLTVVNRWRQDLSMSRIK